MKQKGLTKAQLVVLERLEEVLKEAEKFNIGFVYDNADCSLTAFNAENVRIMYCGRSQESDDDEKINWDLSRQVQNFTADYFDNGFDNYYLNFNEKK